MVMQNNYSYFSMKPYVVNPHNYERSQQDGSDEGSQHNPTFLNQDPGAA